MWSEDNFQYAVENTEVIVAPERQIETFGTTSFRFHLISEQMDRANMIRVRDGRIEAERPQLVTPEHLQRIMLEGFGDKAARYLEQVGDRLRRIAVLKYGFQFRKSEVTENVVHDSIASVVARTKASVQNSREPRSAVIRGVDDAWEVCLLKFTIDLIERSSGDNLGDFRRRGLI